jgi:hypothetical protein
LQRQLASLGASDPAMPALEPAVSRPMRGIVGMQAYPRPPVDPWTGAISPDLRRRMNASRRVKLE